MSFTTSYLNTLYANHNDLKHFYNQSLKCTDRIYGSIEVAGRYITVTVGHIGIALSLTLTPIALALDLIKELGHFFIKLLDGNNNAWACLFCIGLIGVGAYCLVDGCFGDITPYYDYEVCYWQSIYPNLDVNHPQNIEVFTSGAQASMAAMVCLGSFCCVFGGVIMKLIDETSHSGYFNQACFNAELVTKIALSVFCPPLVYRW